MLSHAAHAAEDGSDRISWFEAGSGDPIVLVHGLGTSGAWWNRTIPALAERHRVLVVDLVGFGRSRGQPVRLGAAADQLAAWARATGLERAAFVGHSMGGLVVADLAARVPDLVERLILVDAAGLALPQHVTRHLANVVRGGGSLPLEVYPIALGCALQCGPVTIARAAHQILATDLADRLGRISAPTLVIWGARDRLLTPAFGRRLAAAITGARFETIDGAGHSPMWEQPAEFERRLETFLAEPPTTAGSVRVNEPAAEEEIVEALPSTGGRVASRYLALGDRTIHARLGRPTGPLDTPPIVFVHGLLLASRGQLPTMRRLARRHLVFAPDLPGFGWSLTRDRALDVPGLGRALIAAMDAAGIGRAVLVGHGLGSQVAAQVVADHPDRVLGTVLVGPTFDPAEPSPVGQVRRLLADVAHEWPSLWLEHVPALILSGPRRALATLDHARAHRIESVMPEIRVPTVVVRGEHDPLAPRRWVRELAALAPMARALEVRGAGHALAYGAPKALARIVDDLAEAVATAVRPRTDGVLPMRIVTATHRRRPAARPRRTRAGPPRG
jgi:pimeloyl-ACP methyl ester carboxylesterase